MVGLLSVASLVGSLPAATWTESFEGRFSKDFFVEPQDMGGGWSNVRINVSARDAAINAGDFTSYFAKLTAWLDQQVPADPAQITKKTTQALLGDPAFMAALVERHFMAKVCGPDKGMGNLNAFAKAGPKNKEFLRWVMSNGSLMDELLLTRTPSAMFARKDDSHDLNAGMLENWQQIYAADPASRQGLYLRLAVACVLRPPGSGNQGAGEQGTPASAGPESQERPKSGSGNFR